MGSHRVIAMVLTFSMLSQIAYAQKISFLDKGQVAKFDGVLLEQELFLQYELNRDNDTTTKLCELKLSQVKETIILDYDYRLKIKDIEIKSKTEEFKTRLNIKEDNIEFLENQAALRPPSLLDKWKFELGVISGVALTILLVAVIDEVRFE